MRAFLFVFVLAVSFISNAQVQVSTLALPHLQQCQELHGKVKAIKRMNLTLYDTTGISAKHIDSTEYWVDSFNTSGQRIAGYRVINDTVTDTIKIKLDNRGHIIDEQWHSLNVGTSYHVAYTYNKCGNMIKRTSYDAYGKPGNVVGYTYASGRLTEETEKREGETWRYTYQYDKKGKLSEKYIYNPWGLKLVYKYAYNAKQNAVTEQYIYGKGKHHEAYRYKYDVHDNIVLRETLNQDGTSGIVYRAGYTYDSKGNWIRYLEYGGRGYLLRVRQITYY